MSTRLEGHEKAERARAFVEGLADFLKISILYPPTNTRVQDGAESLVRLRESLVGADGKLPLLLVADHFKVGDTEVESGKANVGWFADCCQKTNLAGLYFDRALKKESLFELAKALHKGIAGSSGARTFEEFWPEKFEGIHLLELRFRGSFGESEDDASGDLMAEILKGVDPDSREAALATLALESDRDLVTRIGVLHEVLGEAADTAQHSGPPAEKVHPIRVIIDNLPREAFQDLDAAASKVKDVLDQVIQAIERNSGDLSFGSFEGLTQKVITRAFRRDDSSSGMAEPSDSDLWEGEPDDVVREMDDLLSELERLPEDVPAELDRKQVDAPAEKLGIVLYQYARAETQEARARLESLAFGYLESAAAEELAVLDGFLHLLCSPRIQPEAQVRIARFAQSLRDSKLAHLLTQFKRFSKQALVDSFPASFGLFIDTIDIGDENESKKILLACRAIGVEKIMAHREFLGTRAGILAPGRVKKILALSSRDVLPLVQIVLDYDTRADTHAIVRCLAAQNLKGAEAAALRAVPPERLPREYLRDLCDVYVKGSYPPGLSKTSESLLHRFVNDPPRSSAQMEQQARAVMALGEFPTRETKELVRALAKGAGILGLKKAPRPIHHAAKIVSRMFSGGP